ncbi:MAG: hypothetical protein K2L98_01375 [Bacilli bacterium]|nr:hypothetical protein [Bacilli bacterium]
MKKKFVLVLLMTMTCLTGCVEYKSTMDIKSDKSMNFSVDYAVDTTIFGEEEAIDAEDKQKLENDGFKVEPYEHDSMKGYRITKNIKNIDSYSSNEDVKYNLSGILNEDNKNDKIFKVKKGLFKNTYYATFEFDASDSGLSDSEAEDPTNEEDIDDSFDDDSLNDLTNSLMSNLDLSFNIKLPNKAINHNAKSVNNDGKELKWDLSTNSVDSITFSFSLYNTTNIIICAVVVVIVLAILIIFVKKKMTANKDKTVKIDNKEE